MNLAVMMSFMVLAHSAQSSYLRGRTDRLTSANDPCWPLTSGVWRPRYAPMSSTDTFHEGGHRVTKILDGRGTGGVKHAVGASHSHR